MTIPLMTCAEILLPAGRGPFPVVVQMHGCGGVQPMQRRYADAASDPRTVCRPDLAALARTRYAEALRRALIEPVTLPA